MAKDKIARYLWIVDTILKYKKLSKAQLNELWMKSSFSDGNPMADRTFYKYRRGIEETFGIEIVCDSDGSYWIDSNGSISAKQLTDMTLNSTAALTSIQKLGTYSDRIVMEDVPSAREYLPLVAEAMHDNINIVFTYSGFSRTRPEVGILFSPYFLKLYKQRWYMFGAKDGRTLRTYALDRVTEMELTGEKFAMPLGINVNKYFGNIVGVTTSKAPIREVIIQTTTTRAKYLRALPLHHTQEEEIHDFYSIFTYRLKINYELVSELMAMGPDVTVIAPRELQMMLLNRLKETLDNYK